MRGHPVFLLCRKENDFHNRRMGIPIIIADNNRRTASRLLAPCCRPLADVVDLSPAVCAFLRLPTGFIVLFR